jgi:hypothetical protein
MALTVVPCGASSADSARPMPCRPALAVMELGIVGWQLRVTKATPPVRAKSDGIIAKRGGTGWLQSTPHWGECGCLRVWEPALLRLMVLSGLMGCWLISNAAAATLEGATFPDSYRVNGRPLVLNGMGVRKLTIFRIRIYVAALYLPRPSHDAAAILASPEPKVIRLVFIHSGSKAQVEKEYRDGEAKNCGHGECAPSDEVDFERLVAAAPAVEPGDTTTYVFTDKGVQVFANNNMIGDFADVDLAKHLLLGFIGEHAPTAVLRNALLGLTPE